GEPWVLAGPVDPVGAADAAHEIFVRDRVVAEVIPHLAQGEAHVDLEPPVAAQEVAARGRATAARCFFATVDEDEACWLEHRRQLGQAPLEDLPRRHFIFAAPSFSWSSGTPSTDGMFMMSFRAAFQAFWTIHERERS